jgi:hypothetical protein
VRFNFEVSLSIRQRKNSSQNDSDRRSDINCEAEPISPDLCRFNGKGRIGIRSQHLFW